MSNEDKTLRPLVPPIMAIIEDYYDTSQSAALIAHWEARRRQAFIAATAMVNLGSNEEYVPANNFPVLVSRAVITPYEKTNEGQLIKAITLPLLAIIERIMKEPSLMYEIDPRKWEEIVVGSYEASRLFDEVTLTPRSGDRGKDLIAVKKGFGSVRIVESVKRYTPGHVVTAEEVDALIGVLGKQPQTSKGIISTTWEFAPKITEDPEIGRLIPYRLELVNGTDLLKRLKEYTTPKSK